MRLLGHIFYRYLWISFNTLLFYFYRYSTRKHTSGMENIPTDRPVIFCSNHPNAFMDALVLGSTVRRRSWFLARSDVFRKKWLAKVLGFIGIIPIYRLLEGAENLAKNDDTFEKCAKMLEENKAILIFSEGLCIQERRLRKLKKGTARIAFGSEERNNFGLNLTIIPVGINYSSTPWKFRKPVYIRFGKPFAVNEYRELYERDKARAMNVFTRDLESRMKDQLLIIEDPQNDALVEQLEEMFVPSLSLEKGLDPKNQKETFAVSRNIAGLVNKANSEEPGKLAELREKTAAYFAKLKKHGLRDWLISEQGRRYSLFGNFLLLLIGLPFWLFGLVTNYVPYKIPWMIQKKIVKHIEWSASVNGTIGVYLWQFYWLLQSLVVALVFRNWYLLWAFIIAVPVCGFLAQEYWVKAKKIMGLFRFMQVKPAEKEELGKLRKEIESGFAGL